LAAACSVDVSKLRPPPAARDAPAERLRGADAVPLRDADGDSHVDVADTAPPDRPGLDQPVGDDDGHDATLADAAGEAQAAEAGFTDLPLPGEDSGDAASGGTDNAGSDDGAADGGPASDDDAGPDGAQSGDDGAGGASGTGGATGEGGASGTGGTPGKGGAPGKGGTPGTGGTSGKGGATVDPDLVLWYKFDESSGTVAADSSLSGGNGTLSGASGNASFSNDSQVGTHSLRLTPSVYGGGGGYVTTPAPAALAPGAITIALWVKPASASTSQNWARIFDFGSGTGSNVPYLYLTSRAGDATGSPLRFGMSMIGHVTTGEQRLEGSSPLSANVWTHIAVVLPAGASFTGLLYVNGTVAATNDAMTIHPSDIGVTTQNWLGRSPFTSDPYFSGWLDDFRIYRRALSAAEIAALIALR
jgi:hypothetical protein